MFRSTVFVCSLVLLVSTVAHAQVQAKKQVQLQVQQPIASAIELKDGEKIQVIQGAGFQFESPAAVRGDFNYYLKPHLEIQSPGTYLMDFVAPVDLPQGSKIKRIGMCFADSTSKSNVHMELMHYDPIHPDADKGVVAKVKSFQTEDARTFAIAESGPVEDAIVDIRQGYYYLALSLQRHNVYCRFAYAYVVFE